MDTKDNKSETKESDVADILKGLVASQKKAVAALKKAGNKEFATGVQRQIDDVNAALATLD